MDDKKRVVVFGGSFGGTSKKGNSYNIVILYDCLSDKKIAFKSEFFTTGKLSNIDQFHFGDVVEPTLEQAESLSGKPNLVALRKVKESTYFTSFSNDLPL